MPVKTITNVLYDCVNFNTILDDINILEMHNCTFNVDIYIDNSATITFVDCTFRSITIKSATNIIFKSCNVDSLYCESTDIKLIDSCACLLFAYSLTSLSIISSHVKLIYIIKVHLFKLTKTIYEELIYVNVHTIYIFKCEIYENLVPCKRMFINKCKTHEFIIMPSNVVKYLDVSNSKFTNITGFPNLKHLNIGDSTVHKIDSSLYLKTLYAKNSNIVTVHDLNNLEELDISNTAVNYLHKLHKLRKLVAYNTSLRINMPLGNIKYLDLSYSYNLFIKNPIRAKYVNISGNNLEHVNMKCLENVEILVNENCC